MQNDLLRIKNVSKSFLVKGRNYRTTRRILTAVNNVSLVIEKGQIYGLIGESGCGKSTLGRIITRLIKETEGNILFDGTDLTKLSAKATRVMRRDIQMIFQDPSGPLDPRMRVETIIGEPFITHRIYHSKERIRTEVRQLASTVGLDPDQLLRRPNEFSGGQKQRIAIARAIATRPRFILADEPTSALDVSIQAQILSLIAELRNDFGITFLLISHDLGAVRLMTDRVAVMYLGRIVEDSDSASLYAEPRHPYTQLLVDSVPIPDPRFKRERQIVAAEPPDALSPPSGCTFHPRCPLRMPICEQEEPQLQEVSTGRKVACHLYFKDTQEELD